MATVKRGFNFYSIPAPGIGAGDMQTTFASLGTIPVIQYVAGNNTLSTPRSYRNNLPSNLTSLAAFSLIFINNTSGAEITVNGISEANVFVGGGGSAGPLVDIPVTAGTRTISIPGVVFTDTTKLFRSGSEYQKPNWNYTVSGGNTTITIASTEPVISNEEANPTAFQYQLN